MFYFATLFDINYLSRGLTLIHSLNTVLKQDFHLFILTLDIETCDYFIDHPNKNATLISLNEVERTFPELLEARTNRSKIEYYFTLSPILPLFILDKFKFCDRITTLDADIFFYFSPEAIFNSFSKDAILITPHDFSVKNKDKIIYGTFNVSFQSFPNTKDSLLVLNNWKNKCLAWCKDELDEKNNRYADQKYLDTWMKEFNNIEPINLTIMGRAPWNISDTLLSYSANTFLVHKTPLIYYHFHHLRINRKIITHGLNLYKVENLTKGVKKMYAYYIKTLIKNEKKLNNTSTTTFRYNARNYKNLFVEIWKLESGVLLVGNKIVFFNFINFHRFFQKLKRHFRWLT